MQTSYHILITTSDVQEKKKKTSSANVCIDNRSITTSFGFILISPHISLLGRRLDSVRKSQTRESRDRSSVWNALQWRLGCFELRCQCYPPRWRAHSPFPSAKRYPPSIPESQRKETLYPELGILVLLLSAHRLLRIHEIFHFQVKFLILGYYKNLNLERNRVTMELPDHD